MKDVIILGKSATGNSCPFDADEVWGVNNVASHPVFQGRKIDKLFAFDVLPKEYTDGMKAFAPICSWQDYKDIDYPLDDVIKTFDTRYFTNTISYMVAYAAYLKIERIRVYGVDVTFGAPYAQENRGVEYWLGRAQERGCKVEVPPDSHLLRTVSGSMYGVKDNCNVMLYLQERVQLINMLPQTGNYTDTLKAHNAHWVLMPKQDEAEAHCMTVSPIPGGGLNFSFRDPTPEEKARGVMPGEFLSDVHMPPETWAFIRKLLIDAERENKLPYGALSIYEKLILSQPEGGN